MAGRKGPDGPVLRIHLLTRRAEGRYANEADAYSAYKKDCEAVGEKPQAVGDFRRNLRLNRFSRSRSWYYYRFEEGFDPREELPPTGATAPVVAEKLGTGDLVAFRSEADAAKALCAATDSVTQALYKKRPMLQGRVRLAKIKRGLAPEKMERLVKIV